MDDITDEILMAHCDGELDPAEEQRVLAYLAEHPEAASRVRLFEVTGKRLRDLFPDFSTEPTPERILAVLNDPAFSAVHTKSRSAGGLSRLAQAVVDRVSWKLTAAAACSAFVGLAVGLAAQSRFSWDLPFSSIDQAGLRVNAGFQRVLDRVPSGQLTEIPGSAWAAKLVFSFESKDGRYCRQFEMQQAGSKSMSGVACRNPGDPWQLALMTDGATSRSASAQYAPSGRQPAPAAVDAYVTALMSGIAFGEQEETGVIDRNWSRGTR